jgi:hypothetical protein
MRKELEKDIQSAVLQFLRLNKYCVWKQNSAGIYNKNTGHYIPTTMPGIADIIGIDPKGRFVAVEVKRPGGRLSDLQVGFQRMICASNGLYACVHSIDEMALKVKEWKHA